MDKEKYDEPTPQTLGLRMATYGPMASRCLKSSNTLLIPTFTSNSRALSAPPEAKKKQKLSASLDASLNPCTALLMSGDWMC